ncbi:MAG: cytochrome c3 family protein [Syntrophomonadaceae bacterium]|nr:cytochrome c3 family protein [Syntrophomonadaceae bacterium]
MSDLEDKERKKFLTGKTVLIVIAVLIIVGGGIGAGLFKASEKPAFCASCHNMESYYTSWIDSNLLANKHEKADVTCHDCHQASISAKINEGLKYITGDYKTPMEKHNFGTREMCFQCHSDAGTGSPKGDTFDTATSETAFAESNPHANHNGVQDCNMCHSMHQQSEIMCVQCHEFSWYSDLDSSWKKN